VIEVRDLRKQFRKTTAVDGLTFRVHDGRITGFLGPNGAGKTTTLRILLGLVLPRSGTATIDGRRYRALEDPIRRVGAVLEATNFHPKRSGRNHLRMLAAAGGVPGASGRCSPSPAGTSDQAPAGSDPADPRFRTWRRCRMCD
jgi:ABC-2 type transport system ATP-binding protein